MIEFTVGGVSFRICFSFLFIAALMTLISGDTAAEALLACILHETGHMAAMAAFGMKIRTVSLYGAGMKITRSKGRIFPFRQEAAVLSAGCAVNFLLYAVFRSSRFGLINLFLGVFNLLPAGALDGGRLLRLTVAEGYKTDFRKALNICRIAGCLTAFFLAVSAFVLNVGNITVYAASAFMLITALTENS